VFGESSTLYEDHMQHNIENSELTYLDPLLLLLLLLLLYPLYGKMKAIQSGNDKDNKQMLLNRNIMQTKKVCVTYVILKFFISHIKKLKEAEDMYFYHIFSLAQYCPLYIPIRNLFRYFIFFFSP